MKKYSRSSVLIGEHKHYDLCRFCLHKSLRPFIHFGNVPLAGGFFSKDASEKDFAKERLYPLEICFCTHCGLVQASDVVDSRLLFEHYFYYSSAIGTVVSHFEAYAKELAESPFVPKNAFVVEIGCNDGVFLKPLQKQGFTVLGVDPAANVVTPLQKTLPIMCAYFGEKVAKRIVVEKGRADIIVGSNSLAHIDDMHDVCRGIKLLLKEDGFLSMETHYLGTLLREYQYDFMYHEHQSYYSLAALENFFAMYGMEVFDVKAIELHAGSMRYFIQHKHTGTRKVHPRVLRLREHEKTQGLGKFATYASFSSHIRATKEELLKLLLKLKKQGKTIAGYGASGRATIIMSYCGLTKEHLDFVIDDAPAKQGAFTPGNHLPIRDSSILSSQKSRPDYCLLLAWSFAPEIKKRNSAYLAHGGKFITPLPLVKILS